MCGVDVLDKGCGGIHVQVYVGCRVFEVVKSYLCVSVPVLDDDWYHWFLRGYTLILLMISPFISSLVCFSFKR